MQDKKCSKCKKMFPASCFNKDARRPSGYRSTCRDCGRLNSAKWKARKTNSDEPLQLIQTMLERERYVALNPNLKWCHKGQHFVERINFSKWSKSGDGLQPKCKTCAKNFDIANAESIKASRKQYRVKNSQRISQAQKEHYKTHKAEYNKRNSDYAKRNKSKMKQMYQNYYINNKDRLKRKSNRYYHENKDRMMATQRAYYKANPERYKVHSNNRRKILNEALGKYTYKQWQDKIEYFGFRCYLCNESLKGKTIHIEHRKPISRGGSNWIANIAPACKKCNLSKSTKTEKEFREWKLTIGL